MSKSNPEISIPGAPAAPAAPDTAAAGPGNAGNAGNAQADSGPDPRDAEIARLRAELAATDPSKMLVTEGDGPNTRRYKAESKHLHLSAAQLHEQVMAGKVKLTDHHVLCKDGWYVNPDAQKQANG